jgi:hypothetical protein
MILPLQNALGSEVFLSQLTQFSQGNNILDPPASNIDNFLTRDTVLFHSLEWGYFALGRCSSHFKSLRDRQHLF